jgi:membrane protein required for colicin V production
MNWFDIVLLVMLGFAVFTGLLNGFFRSLLGIAGMIVGLLFAPRISSALAEALTDTVGSEATASVVAYVIVFAAILVIFQVLGIILKGIVGALMLGWADRLAGAALGLAMGVLTGLAFVAVMARLAFLIPDEAQGQVQVRDTLVANLTESKVVGYYLGARTALPGAITALVPGDYARAMDELEQRRARS